jgi:hypothetical protein
MATSGLELQRQDGRRSTTTLAEVNDVFAGYGSRLCPLDLSGTADDVRRLLHQPTLTAAERATVLDHFLLARERLVELVTQAGREPHVPGGGATSTLDATHDVQYPELYLVEPGADYSRFDRLHVNRSADGTGVDETLQLLSGRGVRVVQRAPDLPIVTLFLDCPSPDEGWLLSYPGSHPHIASFTDASDGSKILMQIIGPAVWQMDYVDHAS